MTATFPQPLPEQATVGDLAPAYDRIRVLIAEDHPLFREAIARAIRDDPRLELVAQAADGEEAFTLARDLLPDVLVLDQRMPLLDGTAVLKRLQRHDPALTPAVLMLSAFDEYDVVWDAVTHGAAGYLGKDASAAEICAAVTQIAEGRLAFNAKTSHVVNRGFDPTAGPSVMSAVAAPLRLRLNDRELAPALTVEAESAAGARAAAVAHRLHGGAQLDVPASSPERLAAIVAENGARAVALGVGAAQLWDPLARAEPWAALAYATRVPVLAVPPGLPGESLGSGPVLLPAIRRGAPERRLAELAAVVARRALIVVGTWPPPGRADIDAGGRHDAARTAAAVAAAARRHGMTASARSVQATSSLDGLIRLATLLDAAALVVSPRDARTAMRRTGRPVLMLP